MARARSNHEQLARAERVRSMLGIEAYGAGHDVEEFVAVFVNVPVGGNVLHDAAAYRVTVHARHIEALPCDRRRHAQR